MKRLVTHLIIALVSLGTFNAMADGHLRDESKSLTAVGRTADLNSYLKDICGTTSTSNGCTVDGTPNNKVGDVYFVSINDYWVGVNSNYSVYNQVNKGITSIDKLSDDSKQTTSSGSFYTYEARNANKFFFIVRRATMKTRLNYTTYPCCFVWYDEWSYVEDPSNAGYSQLYPCWERLKEGKPFPSPHNCDNSLNTNHYITLNEPEEDGKDHYNFTAYLYVPKVEETVTYVNEKTYYVGGSSTWGGGVVTADTELYYKSGDTYKSLYPDYAGQNYSIYKSGSAKKMTLFEKQVQETETFPNGAVPYVFFYNVKMNPGTTVKKASVGGAYECTHNVELNWNTAFDLYANEAVQKDTKYDTMKEEYVVQRSYDKTNWEDIGDPFTVNGNNVITAADKKTTDTGLKDFNDMTKELGYVVYYRVISNVQKTDGTQMSTTVSNVIHVDIPGSVPFSLTLNEGGTSRYNAGYMDGIEYKDGSNTFTNTLVAAETAAHDPVTLATNAVLALVRTDGDHLEGTIIKSAQVSDPKIKLADLVGQIGTVTESFTTKAGESKDATYQLILTVPNGDETLKYYSNYAIIANSKAQNIAAAVHRSGTPDAATCSKTELFRNEVEFTPARTGVGTGYYIYRNGVKLLTLIDNGNGKFSNSMTGKEEVLNGSRLKVVDYIEDAPIAEGENLAESAGTRSWNYAVVHFDDAKVQNTYGSAAKESAYDAGADELVVSTERKAVNTGYSYSEIVTSTALEWSVKATEDVPARGYVVYRSVDGGKYEVAKEITDPATTAFTDVVKYARKPQTSGSWVNKPTPDEYKDINYYVKELVETTATEQNKQEKNSNIVVSNASQGSIFTAIEGVDAENVAVTVADGIITVTGVSGVIEVYSASGTLVARATGNGEATEIDATALAAGTYIVKAAKLNSTKILIK